MAAGDGAWSHLIEFVRHYDGLGRLQPLFPLFAAVDARIERKYEPGLIIAVDVSRTDFDDTSYTVAAAFDEGALPIDLPVKQVRFSSAARGPHSASALAALPTSSATTPPAETRDLDKVPYYTSYLNYTEPTSLEQALLLPDAAHWRAAVAAELRSLGVKGCMLYLLTKPAGARLLETKWAPKTVFKSFSLS